MGKHVGESDEFQNQQNLQTDDDDGQHTNFFKFLFEGCHKSLDPPSGVLWT